MNMEKPIEVPKNYFPVIDVDHILDAVAGDVPFTEAGFIMDRKVCSNTLIPFIKEQEAKKRQQMKKRGKRR